MPEAVPPPRSSRPRSSTMILVALTGVVLLVFAATIGVVVVAVRGTGGGDVAEGSFLQVRLAGEISDAPAVGGFYFDAEDAPPILTDVAWAIREAKDDERIKGMYLVLEDPTVGLAGAQELRDAIGELRAAGKPCVAYSESYTTGAFYLASACDEVVLAPAGVGLVTGLNVTQTYYLGTFEKIGVQAEMLHVGDFKSAVEPYQRTGPSEPAAAAMNEMLDSLWGQIVGGIAQGRGKTVEEVQAWIDHPALSPVAMKAVGMVDVLAYPDQVRANAHRVGEEGWADLLSQPVTEDDETIDDRFTSLKEYLKSKHSERWGSGPKIAVVFAEGPIMSGEAGGGLFGGGQMVADRTFRKWMNEILEDEDVKAVVLRVNSPGGSGTASDMMWRDLQRVSADGKPIVVSMGNYAASGGYYISAPADWIVAQPSTLTGSIGVFGGKIEFDGTYEKLGLTLYTFKRGAEADLLSATAPFSENGRAVYQAFLDDFYETFLGRVSAGRELTRDEVHLIAQGRVWTGEQALERKLVDQLGGLDEAITKAAELASLTDYSVAQWPTKKSFLDVMLEDLEKNSSMSVEALPEELLGFDADGIENIVMLHRILAGNGVAALLPGALHVE